jgi:multisubunit Na+/H+ antiporter MnhE subunit
MILDMNIFILGLIVIIISIFLNWTGLNRAERTCILGFLIGGFVAYLNRPVIPLFGRQLPIETIIIRGGNLEGFERVALGPLAELSFNYILTGFILGAVLGWIIGKIIKE